LKAGIDVEVKLLSKKLQNMNLLRWRTHADYSIAMLFAFIKVKISPFWFRWNRYSAWWC